MIIHDSATLVRTVYDLYNAHQTDPDWLDKISTLADANCEAEIVASNERYQGRDGLKQFFNNFATALPDSRVEVTRVVAADDGAAVEFVARGTLTGVLKTPMGDIQPTGRKLNQRTCEVYQIENDHIKSLHCYFDMRSFAEQLGLPQK